MDQKVICMYLFIHIHAYYLYMYTSIIIKEKLSTWGGTWEELKGRFLRETGGIEGRRQSVAIPFQLKTYWKIKNTEIFDNIRYCAGMMA